LVSRKYYPRDELLIKIMNLFGYEIYRTPKTKSMKGIRIRKIFIFSSKEAEEEEVKKNGIMF